VIVVHEKPAGAVTVEREPVPALDDHLNHQACGRRGKTPTQEGNQDLAAMSSQVQP